MSESALSIALKALWDGGVADTQAAADGIAAAIFAQSDLVNGAAFDQRVSLTTLTDSDAVPDPTPGYFNILASANHTTNGWVAGTNYRFNYQAGITFSGSNGLFTIQSGQGGVYRICADFHLERSTSGAPACALDIRINGSAANGWTVPRTLVHSSVDPVSRSAEIELSLAQFQNIGFWARSGTGSLAAVAGTSVLIERVL